MTPPAFGQAVDKVEHRERDRDQALLVPVRLKAHSQAGDSAMSEHPREREMSRTPDREAPPAVDEINENVRAVLTDRSGVPSFRDSERRTQ